MLALSDPTRPQDRRLLQAAGGFAWWYVDLLDARGDGVVLIPSFGLPFLPGYTDAARRGHPQRPADRPSLNVAVYEGGRCTFYLLQEYDPADVSWAPGTERLRLGGSLFDTRLEGDRRVVDAVLDCPLPGTSSRLTGTLRAEGYAVHHQADAPGPHHWTPLLAAARGRARLSVGSRLVTDLEGQAYHDRNGSEHPVDALGIDHWVWGHAAAPGRDYVWYLLWAEQGPPLALGLGIDAAGQVTGPFDLAIERSSARRARYGMRWWERLHLRRDGEAWLDAHYDRPVDDGPFYLRHPVRTTAADGTPARGWGEVVRPDRVDLPLHRPFVRMRVHHAHGPNSPFVPLFTGPAEGRVRRWLGGAP